MIPVPPHVHETQRWAGRRIGLLGGSFNPPHEGHLHVAHVAQHMMKLDAVWWLLTPQNPLKTSSELETYEKRLELCQNMIAPYPSFLVSDWEYRHAINRSYDTIKSLRTAFSQTDFVWLTGTDNAQSFHRWYRWKDILSMIATAHIARPPAHSLIENSPLRMCATQEHIVLERAAKVPLKPRKSYWIMQKKMIDISSTEIRKFINNK